MRKTIITMLILFVCIGYGQTSDLSITSDNAELVEHFNWAKNRALELVITGETPENGGPTYTEKAYWGSYAHDPAYYSRDIAHQSSAGHLLGLDEENYHMIKQFAKSIAEPNVCSSGWMAWNFNFYGVGGCFDSSLPSPFEIVQRAYENYLWTGNNRWINNPDLNTFYKHVMENIVRDYDPESLEEVTDDALLGNGVVGMPPNDGTATYHEFPSEEVYEAGDSFGSQYQATLAYAAILRIKGQNSEADKMQQKAEALKNYFEDNWYSNATRRYIRGFLTDGTPLSDWGHEPSFFMPLKKLIEQGEERGQNYIDFVHISTMNKPINIEAQTYYAEAFYNNEQNHLGWHWLLKVMRSRHSYPEVAYLSVSNTVEGLMGVRPDAPKNSFFTIPRLTKSVDWVQVANIPIGNKKITVRHDGDTSTTATNNSAGTITWEAQFYGKHSELIVDGSSKKAQQKQLNGKTISYVSLSLKENTPITVTVPNKLERNVVYLSDIEPTVTAGTVFKETNANSYIMMVRNTYFTKGISTKNGTEATYDVSDYSLFQAQVGVDRQNRGTMNFQLWNADNNPETLLFETGNMNRKDALTEINIDVRNIDALKLVTVGSQGNVSAIWGDARLIRDPATELKIEVVSVTDADGNLLIGPARDKDFDAECDYDDDVKTDSSAGARRKPCDPHMDYPVANHGTVNLNLKITNVGSVTSGDITLGCSPWSQGEDYITINNGTGPIGNIAGGGEIRQTINASINADTPGRVPLEFTITANDGASSKNFVETLTTPYSILHFLFDDFNRDLKNKVFTSGKKTTITLPIQNLGRTVSNTITATCEVIEGAEYVELASGDDSKRVDPIPAMGSTNVNFQINVKENVTGGKRLKFRFTVADGVSRRVMEIDYTVARPDFKIAFNSLLNTHNNKPMVGIGQESDYTINVKNEGKASSKGNTQMTVRATGANASLVTLNNTSFDLGILEAGEVISETINFTIADNAQNGDVIAFEIQLSDGTYSEIKTQRFVVGTINVSDMPLTVIRGHMNRDTKQQSENPIRLGGVAYEKGLGVHAPSEILVRLDGEYSRFTSIVGIDESINTGSVVFNVYNENGINLYPEGEIIRGNSEGPNATEMIDIDVRGVQTLKLEVTDGRVNGSNSDHANWGNARLELLGGSAPVSDKVWIEAESASSQSPFLPFVVVDENEASNAQYINVPDTRNENIANRHGVNLTNGIATYDFDMSGTINMWVRIFTPEDRDDSFWYKLDSEAYNLQNHHVTTNQWEWIKIKNNYELSKGEHTLTLAQREDGTRIDKFLITTDLDFNPSGKGEVSIKTQNANTTKQALVDDNSKGNLTTPNGRDGQQVVLYPNPAKGTISIESAIEIKSLMFFNIHGKHIDLPYSMNKKKVVVDLGEGLSGVFYIKITDVEGNAHFEKLIIK